MLLWGLFLCLTSPFIITRLLSDETLSPHKPVLLWRAKLRSGRGFLTHTVPLAWQLSRASQTGVVWGCPSGGLREAVAFAGSGNPGEQSSCTGAELRHPRRPAGGAGRTWGKEVVRRAGRSRPQQKAAGGSSESLALSFSRIKTLISCWRKTNAPSETL